MTDEHEKIKINRHFTAGELRAVQDETTEEGVIDGYALKFNEVTQISNYFTEEIENSAISEETLRDVAFIVNHDSSRIPLARSRINNKNSTLQLVKDDVGLRFKATLDIKSNPTAQELYSAVKRGDITGMSFWMWVEEHKWTKLDTNMPHRTILKISKILEISAVTWPAYDGTEISARSMPKSLESDKNSLENAIKGLVNTSEIDLRKKVLLFKVKNKL